MAIAFEDIFNSTSAGAGVSFRKPVQIGNTPTSPTITSGAGAPTAAAPQGSIYLNTTGSGVANRMYINTNGATTWTAVSTVA